MHGHVAILNRLLKLAPKMAICIDDEGKTPLHCLTGNVMSSKKELQHMFILLLRANKDACSMVTLEEQKTPLDLLEDRIHECSPYETNLQDVKDVMLLKLKKIAQGVDSDEENQSNALEDSDDENSSYLGITPTASQHSLHQANIVAAPAQKSALKNPTRL